MSLTQQEYGTMIVCSCNRFTDHDIRDAAETLAEKKGERGITANAIYHAVGKRPQCGCCRVMIEAVLLQDGYKVRCVEQGRAEKLVTNHRTARQTSAALQRIESDTPSCCGQGCACQAQSA